MPKIPYNQHNLLVEKVVGTFPLKKSTIHVYCYTNSNGIYGATLDSINDGGNFGIQFNVPTDGESIESRLINVSKEKGCAVLRVEELWQVDLIIKIMMKQDCCSNQLIH